MADRSLLGFFVAPLGSLLLLIGGWDFLLLLMIPFGSLHFTVAICSTLVHFVVNCGFLPPIMGHCGSFWLAVADCGSL